MNMNLTRIKILIVKNYLLSLVFSFEKGPLWRVGLSILGDKGSLFGQTYIASYISTCYLLAPSGALVVIMV